MIGKSVCGAIGIFIIFALAYSHTETVFNALATRDLFTYLAIFLYSIFVLEVLFPVHVILGLKFCFRASVVIFTLSLLTLAYIVLSNIYASSNTEIFGVSLLVPGLESIFGSYIALSIGISFFIINVSLILEYKFDPLDE